jgi:hypothetical protein
MNNTIKDESIGWTYSKPLDDCSLEELLEIRENILMRWTIITKECGEKFAKIALGLVKHKITSKYKLYLP